MNAPVEHFKLIITIVDRGKGGQGGGPFPEIPPAL